MESDKGDMCGSRFRELDSNESYTERSSQSRSRSPREWSRSRSPSRSRTRSRSRYRGHSRSLRHCSGCSSEAAVEEARLLMEQDVIKFCDEHKLDVLASSCVKCHLVSRCVVKAVLPELIRLMKAKAVSNSDIPSAAKRYTSRLDEKALTLTFSDSDLSLAVSLFGHSKMVPPWMFDELTREYLHLPPGQKDVLTKSVQLERMFQKFKSDKNFTNIFT